MNRRSATSESSFRKLDVENKSHLPSTASPMLILAIFITSVSAFAYSQTTHEELIDLLWDDPITPLLIERYPNSTEKDLVRAHAFAYGGGLLQKIGYYPFGHLFFSQLAHYVRSGDFVAIMLQSAMNLDELAFAIGALSHYVGDSIGHSQAT